LLQDRRQARVSHHVSSENTLARQATISDILTTRALSVNENRGLSPFYPSQLFSLEGLHKPGQFKVEKEVNGPNLKTSSTK
jgi:hypothetical protein